MAGKGKYFLLFSVLLIVSSTVAPLTAKALGPPEILSAGGGGTYIEYISIQNQSTIPNPVHLTVCVKASLIRYCYTSVGDIGYSIDGNNIYNITDFINQTIVQEEGFSDDATVWANATLPSLSEGSHTVTVYFGRQFEGKQARYEVFAYSTVNFTIGSESPTPTPTLPNVGPTSAPNSNLDLAPILAVAVVIIAVVAVIALLLWAKHFKRRTLKE
jgi:hypothetical protein